MKIPEEVITTSSGTRPTCNTLHWNVLLSEFHIQQQLYVKTE